MKEKKSILLILASITSLISHVNVKFKAYEDLLPLLHRHQILFSSEHM